MRTIKQKRCQNSKNLLLLTLLYSRVKSVWIRRKMSAKYIGKVTRASYDKSNVFGAPYFLDVILIFRNVFE